MGPMLSSATTPADVAALARAHLLQPAQVAVGPRAMPVAGATQRLLLAGRKQKTALLLTRLRRERGRVLIFTHTKHGADRVPRAAAPGPPGSSACPSRPPFLPRGAREIPGRRAAP